MNLKQLLFAMCILFYGVAAAQNRSVSGKVSDKNGTPLAGVSIEVIGTNIATTSGEDGSFTVTAPSTSKSLRFSYVGYQSIDIDISGKSVVSVQLTSVSASLNEVVVTGYTAQRKKDLTGSVAVVDVNALKSQPAAGAAEALQGRAAGVTVVNDGSPGSTPQVRIRGYSTVNNNDPLYIIDGVPYQGKIAWLNQNDIQSMQVLKDASAASIYGSRASNGVIIITTKNGREGPPRISLDAYYGMSKANSSTFPDFLTPEQYAKYRYQTYVNAGLDPGASLGVMYGPGPNPIIPEYLIAGSKTGVTITPADADPAKYNYNPSTFYQITRANRQGTDWMRAITQDGPIQNYNLGATGGGKNSIYALSFGYLDQKGIIKYTGFKKYTVRANIQFSGLENHLRFGTNLLFSRTEGTGFATNTANAGDGQQTYSPVGNVYKIQPIIPVYDIMGNFAGARGATLGDAKNPLAILYRAKDNNTDENRLFGNFFAELDLIKGLTIATRYGVNLNNSNGQTIRYPAMEDAVSVSVNGYGAAQGYGRQWTWTNTINYKHNFNDIHSISVLAGSEAIKNTFRTVSGARDGYFLLGDLDYYYLNTGTVNITNAETGGKSTLSSLFARADYTLMDKYLFSATIRRDGSSNFGQNNLYGTFPAFSAAWRISSEDFMKNVSWINDLKLRVGYGQTGNQNIPGNNAFDLFQILNTQTYYAIAGGNVLTPGASQNQIGNPDLRWEKLSSTNIGLDFAVLDGKLDGSIDVYSKKTEDMLFPVPLPGQTAGMAASPFRNVGNMSNKGIELVLNYHHRAVTEKAFGFDLTANIAANKNEITELAPGISRAIYGAGGLTTTVLQKGQSYGSFFGYVQEGIFQTAQEAAQSTQVGARMGGMKYADVNGDKVINANDRTVLGSPLPDFTYGLNVSATYKNFDLLLFFYGSQGNDIYNVTRNYTDFQVFPSAASTRLLDAWSPTNTDSKVPMPSALANTLEYESSSYYVENGSYFRLKNLQLGYNFKNLNFKGITRLRVYASVTNVFTITKYTGLDPEVSQFNTTFSLPGIDLGVYPNPRQFLIGINTQF